MLEEARWQHDGGRGGGPEEEDRHAAHGAAALGVQHPAHEDPNALGQLGAAAVVLDAGLAEATEDRLQVVLGPSRGAAELQAEEGEGSRPERSAPQRATGHAAGGDHLMRKRTRFL